MEEIKPLPHKRPLWQWIALCVVIGIIGIVYFVTIHKQNANQSTQQVQNSIYKMMPKDKFGTVMTDPKGMTLYTYASDKPEISNCSGKCLDNWPPFVANSQTGNFPANITAFKRPDGTLQYAWKGMPLYYYKKDQDSGDAYGNGVGGVWSVIK